MKSQHNKKRVTKCLNDPISFGRNLFSGNSRITGYELLAIAIVNQAAADYRKELKISNRHNCKTQEAINIERFFNSDYGDLLCFGMADLILEKLRKEQKAPKRTYFSAKRGIHNDLL